MARSRKTPAKTPAPPAAKGAGKGAAKASGQASDAPQGRVAQMRAVWSMTRQSDPKLPLLVFGPALVVLAILVVLGLFVFHHIVIFAIAGVLLGVITGTTIFGRRATSSMYAQVEGRPGAAAAVLQSLRGDWRVTPAVAFTKNQDLVHRVIGRPGIVLIGEGGSTPAIRQLITDQKRRIGRVAPDTPIHELIVGDDDPDRVSIRKLQSKMMRLPRTLKQKDINAVEARMKALGATNVPIPKGPMPTRMPRRQMR